MYILHQEILGKDGEAQLITDGVTRDDIKQGILGDCWFLSSCAAVSQRGQLMSKVGLKNTEVEIEYNYLIQAGWPESAGL